MQPGKFDWVQAVTTLAILFGLALVVWELNQTREMTKLQIVDSAFSDHASYWVAQMGENFSETYAKACATPEELSDSEIFQMLAMHDYLLLHLNRKREYDGLGETETFSWGELARTNVRDILSTKVGHADLRDRPGPGSDPALREIINEALEKGLQRDCSKIYGDMFDVIRNPAPIQFSP